MGDHPPMDTSETLPPPYTGVDPAPSSRRIEPQLPAKGSVEAVPQEKQMDDGPPVHSQEATVDPYRSPVTPPPVANRAHHPGQHRSIAHAFSVSKRRSGSVSSGKSSSSSSSSSSSASSVSTISSKDLHGCTPSSIQSCLNALRSDLGQNKAGLGSTIRQFRDQLKQQTRATSASERAERKKAYKQEYRQLRKEIKQLVKDAVKETKRERKARRREGKGVRKEAKQVRKLERKAATKAQ